MNNRRPVRSSPILMGLFGLAALLAVMACAPADSDRRMVLITVDSVRIDRLTAYGAPVSVLPRMDELAAESIVFEQAFTPAPLTLPALTGALTGRLPSTAGVVDDAGSVVSGDAPRLSGRLLAGGWATGAFVNAPFIDQDSGLLEGFRRAFNPASARDARSAGAPTLFREAAEFLDLHRKVPAFAWVHVYDTHYPYLGEGVTGRGEDRYNASLAAADRALGLFLEDLERRGLADDAVIVVAADHGEGLGEGGERTHGLTLTPATLQVPLLLRLPGSESRRLAAPVSLLDLAPTLAELAGLDPAAEAATGNGRSLAAALGDERTPLDTARALPAETFVPFFSYHWPPLRARLDAGAVRLLEAGAAELPPLPDLGPESPRAPGIELRRDVLETAGRISALLEGGVVDEARAVLEAWPAAAADAPMAARLAAALERRAGDAEAALGRLRRAAEAAPGCSELWSALAELEFELGRASSEAWRRAAASAGLRVRFALHAADSLLREGQVDAALDEVRKAVAGQPPSATLDAALGRLYLRSGRPEEAQPPLADAATRAPGSSATYRLLSRAAEESGSPEGAMTMLEEALRIDPQDRTLHRDLGDLQARQGKLEAAATEWRLSMEEADKEPRASLEVAEHLLRLNLLDAAAAAVDKVRGRHPDDPQAHYIMAQIELARRQPEAAEDELLAALRSGGEQAAVYYGLARTALMKGDESSALSYLDRVFAADDPVLRSALQADQLLTAPERFPKVSRAVESYLAGGAPAEDDAP